MTKVLTPAGWNELADNLHNPMVRKKAFGAIQHFVNKVLLQDDKERQAVKARIRHLATTSDFPTSTLPVERRYQDTDYTDDAWMALFDEVDLRGSNRNGFEITDVSDGLTFELVPDGDKAKLNKMSGDKSTVYMGMYGGGLQWSRRLLDDREFWTLENNAVAFANKWAKKKAQTHYDLIEAVAATYDVAWADPVPATLSAADPNYVAIRDMNTISAACLQIITELKDSAASVGPRSQFYVLAPLELTQRINRALTVLNSGISGTLPGQPWNVAPLFTNMFTTKTKYYVISPGYKMVYGNRMDLTVYDQWDPTSYSDLAVGWGRYGSAIGNIKQIARCATS